MIRQLSVLTLVLMTPIAQAADPSVCKFGKEIVPEVTCYGPTILKDTQINGKVNVVGPLTARSISSGEVTVSGSVDMQDSNVNGPVVISGSFIAKNVVFQQDLTVASADIQFSHVKVAGSMTINSLTTKPYLRLECGSIVSGSVTFAKEPGVVQVSDDSSLKGKVQNGTLEFTHKKC